MEETKEKEGQLEFNAARAFMENEHKSIITTYRRDGAAQMSIVVSGPHNGHVVFVVRGDTAKLANLRRDPRCTVLNVRPDWSAYAVVEGNATLHTWENTEKPLLQPLLRDAFRACGGGEHSDWEEYDRVMEKERRAVVMVSPDRVYGFVRSG